MYCFLLIATDFDSKHCKCVWIYTGMHYTWLNALDYRMGGLKKELAGEKEVKEQLMQEVNGLRTELKEK